MFAREQKQAEEIKVRNHVGTEVQERKDQSHSQNQGPQEYDG